MGDEKGQMGVFHKHLVLEALVGDAVAEEDEVGGEGSGPGRRDGREVGDGDAEADGDHVGGLDWRSCLGLWCVQ